MRSLFFAAACFALAAACSSKREEPAAQAIDRTAPVSPDAPLDLEKPDRARVELDLAAARAEIRTSYQVNGAYPRSLGELRANLSFPADLEYDPATGTVKSRTYPAL